MRSPRIDGSAGMSIGRSIGMSIALAMLLGPAGATGQELVTTCPPGKTATDDTAGKCCWPGQAWSAARKRCIGIPTACPDGMRVQGEQCVAAPRRGAERCPQGMALVRGGTFSTGSSGAAGEEEAIEVATFCLDRTEVTARSYRQCVDAGTCTAADKGGACSYGSAFFSDHPINCIDWEQASGYCAAQRKRLPTEDEWEWAARGGPKGLAYPWGDDAGFPERSAPEKLCWRQAVCRQPGGGMEEHSRTCPVGRHPGSVSPDGVQDLAGNVSEWTATEDGNGYVVRGGSWFSASIKAFECSYRRTEKAGTRKSYVGLRCAVTPSQGQPPPAAPTTTAK